MKPKGKRMENAMEIQTAHFDVVEIDEKKILTFENGLPGLEENKRFALISNEASKPICWLQSLDHQEISLPVMDPFIICPAYSFDIAEEDITALDIEDIKDVFVLNVLVIPQSAHAATINLSAPIIINIRNSRARQIVLDDKRYGVRVSISELLTKTAKDGK